MDDMLTRFRQAADRENRRRPQRRRYSSALQQQAIAYWQQRRSVEGVRTIAASLGVSVTTLQRWTRAKTARPRFRPIEVREAVATRANSALPVVITMTTDGPRVQGLTVDTAARLLALLR